MSEGGGSPLRELLVAFGVEIDDSGLKGLGERLGGVQEKLKAFAETLGAGLLGEKVKEFVQGQVEAGASLKRTAAMLGTGTDELQALQLAAGDAGVPVEAMTTGLRFLSRNMAEAANGTGEAAGLFAKLGIGLKDTEGQTRPVGDVMQDLADHMASMKDPAERVATAMKLTGRSGAELIPLLIKGGMAFEEARQAAQAYGGGISEEFTEQAEEAERAQTHLTFALGGFKSMIAAQFLPSLVAVTSKLTGWVSGAIKLAKSTNALRTAFIAANIGGAVLMFTKLASIANVAKLGFGGAARALAGFAWPILLIGGLYLIFDDLFTLMTGGKSLIGDLLDKYEGIGTAAALTENLKGIWAELTDLWAQAGPLLESGFVEAIKSAYDVVRGIAQLIIGAVQNIGGLAKFIGGDKKGGEAMMAGGDKSTSAGIASMAAAFQADDHVGSFGPGQPKTRDPLSMQRGKAPEEYFAPVPMLPGKGGAAAAPGPTTITNSNKFDVRVTGVGGDPKDIGKAVSDGMADSMQRQLHHATSALGGPA